VKDFCSESVSALGRLATGGEARLRGGCSRIRRLAGGAALPPGGMLGRRLSDTLGARGGGYCQRLGGLGLMYVALVCAAQPQSPPSWSVRVAADEETLWLARITSDRSLFLRRGPSGGFELFDPLNATVVEMVAGAGGLHVLVDDGALYATSAGGWARRLDLPGRALPLDWVADGATVIALVPSPPAGQLPRLVDGSRPATSQPFDPGDAPLSVVRHDSQGWIAAAPCPVGVTANGPFKPRVATLGGLLFLGHVGDRREIELLRWEAENERWEPAGNTPPIGDLHNFWLLTINRIPTVVATQRADRGEEIVAFRLVGRAIDGPAQWRPVAFHLSDLPKEVEVCRYLAAGGFNQHLVLLAADQTERLFLRFARLDSAPTEKTVSLTEVFTDRRLHGQPLRWVQGSTLLLLFAVLLALFVFRRGALVTPAELPPQLAIALTFQRLLATVIDLGPFILVSAAVMNVDWQRGLQELFGWAAGAEAAAGKFPDARTLIWWTLSSGVHTVYVMALELAAGRTVGKMVAGTRVLSQTGTPASAVQIVVRNLLRLIELLPPLWVLAFLVVLSRNRQRLGDIFARTIVVRALATEKPPEQE